MVSVPRIAIDAMGGDAGVEVMVAGAARAHARRSDFRFILFGDETKLRAELAKYPALAGVADVEHCTDLIQPTD